jgi:zinc protease
MPCLRPVFLLFLAVLSACAPQQARISAVSAAAPERIKPVWAFEQSDVPLDPAFRFGRLANGMRYVIRHNANPEGTALVRMQIDAGSLDESEEELGYAHYVEHMAFNGSTNVPEGEMVRLLERQGLAFGADTNATTSFERTTYRLDLPRNDPALLDTALMLLRETASELSFTPTAVERERGVILSELRDRNTWQYRNTVDQIAFLHPNARYARRMPIGTEATLRAATAQSLKAFWQREYVPRHTTLIVVGDFEPTAVEQAINDRFGDWAPAPVEPQPDPGPVDYGDQGRTDIHLDPALTERVTASRHGPWPDETDTVAQRRENMLRQIGYNAVNRRLTRLARVADPPFRDAGFGTGSVFEAGITTNLVVYTADGKWRRGLTSAVREYRRALTQGFTEAEIAEQIAVLHNTARGQAASAETRSNAGLVSAVLALINEDRVPSTPQSALERLEAFIPQITPEAVLAALKREAVPLDRPLLRFEGRRKPQGGERAIRAAWDAGSRAPLSPSRSSVTGLFAYTDFGPPGEVISDAVEPLLGIRQVRFANGVRLNLKRTELQRDRIIVQLNVDGGDMLATKDNPLAIEMVTMLTAGGLGMHSQDELQSLLAGRTVNANLTSTPETFVATGQTSPRDLELQLQVMAAFITDPGYRPEGEQRYRLGINNRFAQLRATPSAALSSAIGGILSDNDPRFTLQPQADYQALTFARLKSDIADRLQRGAIEIGVVGDIDEDQTIALVARTFGALPPREHDFRPYPDQRRRAFTADRSLRIVRHAGPPDQALVRLTWPTRDDSDGEEKQVLNMLERTARIALLDRLRERLGKAYSPSARSAPSPFWTGYGTFSINVSVHVADVPEVRAAIYDVISELREEPLDPDLLRRAREPLLESFANALKTNGGWIQLVDRAQTEPDRIERQVHAAERLQAVTAEQVQAAARRYLAPDRAVEILVLPDGVPAPPS